MQEKYRGKEKYLRLKIVKKYFHVSSSLQVCNCVYFTFVLIINYLTICRGYFVVLSLTSKLSEFSAHMVVLVSITSDKRRLLYNVYFILLLIQICSYLIFYSKPFLIFSPNELTTFQVITCFDLKIF